MPITWRCAPVGNSIPGMGTRISYMKKVEADAAAQAAEIERLRTWLEVIRDNPELFVISERKAAALALSGNPAPQRREPNG